MSLGKVAAAATDLPVNASKRDVLDAMLKAAAHAEVPLSELQPPLVLNRARRTLIRHAKRLGLSFPDYKPRKEKE